MPARTRFIIPLALLGALACSSDRATAPARSFLDGTAADPEIGIVVNSTGKAVTLFQLGAPDSTREIALGASSTVTPTGLSLRGELAAVPLGNAASVALVDLAGERTERFFIFASGNATGSAFVDDTTVLAANTSTNVVGKFTTGQASDAISDTVHVAPAPTAVVAAGGRGFVISGNLDENFTPIGDGIVTAIDPSTMSVVGTVGTGGQNPTAATVGPDGKLYVVNTGDFVSDGSVAVIDPSTLHLDDVVSGFGPGPGSIHIDAAGVAYVSGFFTGTVVWNTHTRQFVRGPDNPVCAPNTQAAGSPCRGAFDAAPAADGSLYQVFFGSASDGLTPYVFVYRPGPFALADSISVGVGPSSIDIRSFQQ